MQETRQYILKILKERGQATVEEIVADLQQQRGKITSVTVRHHLSILQEDNLITTPELQHRNTPGRPRHVYALTNKAFSYFPNNYQRLASSLLNQIQIRFPSEEVNVILEGVADSLASEACIPAGPMPNRLDATVDYLKQQGYNAHWESDTKGYTLHVKNCPYHGVAHRQETVCQMDARLITTLLGIVPRITDRISSGDSQCTFFIPDTAE